MLGLEAKAAAVGIGGAGLARDVAVEEIPRVELNAGLGGEDFHDTAGSGLTHGGREGERTVGGVEHPVVVVAAAEAELRMVLADTGADDVGRGEVEGGVRDRGEFTRGNQAGSDRGVTAGAQHDFVAEDVAAAGTGEVEITVVGEIHGGGAVRGGGVVDAQALVGGEGVRDLDGEGARVALVAVGARVAEAQGGLSLPQGGCGGPQHFVEAEFAAVEMTGDAAGSVVGGEGVGLAVERELAAGHTVADAADQGAEERRVLHIGRHGVEPEGDIGETARAVGHEQAHDGPAKIGDFSGETGRLPEGVEAGLAAVGECSEGLHSDRG